MSHIFESVRHDPTAQQSPSLDLSVYDLHSADNEIDAIYSLIAQVIIKNHELLIFEATEPRGEEKKLRRLEQNDTITQVHCQIRAMLTRINSSPKISKLTEIFYDVLARFYQTEADLDKIDAIHAKTLINNKSAKPELQIACAQFQTQLKAHRSAYFVLIQWFEENLDPNSLNFMKQDLARNIHINNNYAFGRRNTKNSPTNPKSTWDYNVLTHINRLLISRNNKPLA